PPRNEQVRIASEVERLLSISDTCLLTVSANRDREAKLRQSILKWAFEGKLVDQDPNDEPASELLARIRKQRKQISLEAKNTTRRSRKSENRGKQTMDTKKAGLDFGDDKEVTVEELFARSGIEIQTDFTGAYTFYQLIRNAVNEGRIQEHRRIASPDGIEFDSNQQVMVLVGENGTAKSNLLEALVTIFRDLDRLSREDRPSFSFKLKYSRNRDGKEIEVLVDAATEREKEKTRIWVDGKKFAKSKVSRGHILPELVVGYYSGSNLRMKGLFEEHLDRSNTRAVRGSGPEFLRRLFYLEPIHSQFAILALLADKSLPEKALTFLKEFLGIEALESALIVASEPTFRTDRDTQFWGLKGLVSDLLERL
ncbi:Type-1 restriction enzyme EcoAI specificity protein, partial [Exaiptasia diaphana]